MRASPRTAAPDPITTSSQGSLSQICGFWTEPGAPPNQFWQFHCQSACAIDVQVTPHIIFCPGPGYIPDTSWYDYGKWPSTGCGYREVCCTSGDKALSKAFDNGATIYGQCVTTTDPHSNPMTATTEVPGTSLRLSVWNAAGVTGTGTTTSSTSQALATTSSSSSAVRDQPQTSQTPQTVTAAAGPAAESGLSIGAEVGSILGAVFGAVAIAIAVYFGRKQFKLQSRP